jgi:hypothetical protein
MSFTAANLVRFGNGAGSKGLFHYWSNDLFTGIDDSDYFLAAYDKLALGDLIFVSSDLDGTPLNSQLIVTASSSSTVTTTPTTTATITSYERYAITVPIVVLGTASTTYVVVPRAGSITKVLGVTDVSGLGSGGTSTVTITVPTTGAIATLPFLQDTAAGAVIEDTSITAHTALLANGVITVATDGTGSHTGVCRVTLEFTPG